MGGSEGYYDPGEKEETGSNNDMGDEAPTEESRETEEQPDNTQVRAVITREGQAPSLETQAPIVEADEKGDVVHAIITGEGGTEQAIITQQPITEGLTITQVITREGEQPSTEQATPLIPTATETGPSLKKWFAEVPEGYVFDVNGQRVSREEAYTQAEAGARITARPWFTSSGGGPQVGLTADELGKGLGSRGADIITRKETAGVPLEGYRASWRPKPTQDAEKMFIEAGGRGGEALFQRTVGPVETNEMIQRDLERRGVPLIPGEGIGTEEKALRLGLGIGEKIGGAGEEGFVSGFRKGVGDLITGTVATAYMGEQVGKRLLTPEGRGLIMRESEAAVFTDTPILLAESTLGGVTALRERPRYALGYAAGLTALAVLPGKITRSHTAGMERLRMGEKALAETRTGLVDVSQGVSLGEKAGLYTGRTASVPKSMTEAVELSRAMEPLRTQGLAESVNIKPAGEGLIRGETPGYARVKTYRDLMPQREGSQIGREVRLQVEEIVSPSAGEIGVPMRVEYRGLRPGGLTELKSTGIEVVTDRGVFRALREKTISSEKIQGIGDVITKKEGLRPRVPREEKITELRIGDNIALERVIQEKGEGMATLKSRNLKAFLEEEKAALKPSPKYEKSEILTRKPFNEDVSFKPEDLLRIRENIPRVGAGKLTRLVAVGGAGITRSLIGDIKPIVLVKEMLSQREKQGQLNRLIAGQVQETKTIQRPMQKQGQLNRLIAGQVQETKTTQSQEQVAMQEQEPITTTIQTPTVTTIEVPIITTIQTPTRGPPDELKPPPEKPPRKPPVVILGGATKEKTGAQPRAYAVKFKTSAGGTQADPNVFPQREKAERYAGYLVDVSTLIGFRVEKTSKPPRSTLLSTRIQGLGSRAHKFREEGGWQVEQKKYRTDSTGERIRGTVKMIAGAAVKTGDRPIVQLSKGFGKRKKGNKAKGR